MVKPTPSDLSEQELLMLLRRKRVAARQRRITEFAHTGRRIGSNTASVNKLPTPGDQLATSISLPKSPRRQRMDGLLLMVEMVVLLGIVGLLWNGTQMVRRLNEQVVSSFLQPNLAPTPIIRPIVIPSGHTPPTSHGGARPNIEEIPPHLRLLAQTYADLPVPTPAPEQAIRIMIPALDIDAPVIQGDGWEQLKLGVGQHVGTGLPGQPGNMVLSAHNDIYGELFRYLDRLETGDEVTVFTNFRAYIYVVEETMLVKPIDVWVMEPSPTPTATLISCYPYLVNTERIIVKLNLQRD